ncbi:MAG: HAD-IA family hydrolase [Burkholderiales bacterium]|nr:HAD-IA family hydrolase [Burkholderiales bacterium]
MAIEALIFDVDGTLADTEEAHRVAFNLAFERHRLGWSWSRAEYRHLLEVTGGKERIASYIDALAVSTAERARLRGLVPTLHAEKTRFYTAAVQEGSVALREGVARLIHEALDAGCRLAIASTTTAANIHALLASTLGPRGLDLFSVIACGDQVRAKKPAPDIYRLALATLGLQPEQAVALEDSVNGLRSSTGAGLWTLVTPTFWTEGGDFRAAGLVLPGLCEPEAPLTGEPGCQLKTTGWLRFEELCTFASPPPALTPLQALYQGLQP